MIVLMLGACTHQRTNPFLENWDTPYGLPPFSKIQNSDYLPAIKEGIKQQQDEIEAVVNNTAVPTFENTIAALDKSGELLAKVTGVLFNLSESNSSDSLQKVVDEALPLVTEANDNIYLNKKLFDRVDTLYKQMDSLHLTSEQKRVLFLIHRQFVRNGIALDKKDQDRLREINKELAALQQKFGNNVLAETNAFQLVLDSTSQLSGLPQAVIDAAAADAKAAGYDGKWLITLQYPSRMPFLQYSNRRDLRKKVYEAYVSMGDHGNANDNNQVLLDILNLRIEKAKLLGFETPAAYLLDDKMAKTPATVDKFLGQIMPAALNKAKEERTEMQAIIDKENGGFKLAPWDWAYYAEKLRKEKYDLNEDSIKPYFELNEVRNGMFAVAHKLYGITIKPIKNVPIYYPEVQAYKVIDKDSSLLGIYYTDYFPRASKRSGAWMNNIREQYYKDGKDIRPVIVNVCNFTKPTGNQPALLSIDEVQTMFHEFGHALHGLFAQSNYRTVSGTNVARDFVELPSQFNENWALEPSVLKTYAKNYKTGKVIPDSLIEKIQAMKTFNQGFMTTELTAASILDMKWHELQSVDGIVPAKFDSTVMAQIGMIPEIAPRYHSTYFNHIFSGGYSAGYYGYLWAEVLDYDAFNYFKENGLFNPEIAKKFRTLLEKGGSEDPMQLYLEFRGQKPDPEALLKARGLK